jgi:predicted O-methyltransferase YrrM
MDNNIDEDREAVPSILRELERTAKKEHLPSIGPLKGRIISDIVKKYRPASILEIGTLHGYSAILMGNLLPDDDGKLITIEIDRDLANIATKNIEKAGLSGKIKVICNDAIDVIPTLSGYKFDLVFLDAIKTQYLHYLRLLEGKNLLKEESIVVADNVILYESEMKDYLGYVRNSGDYRSHTTETTLEFNKSIEDALEISFRLKNRLRT